MDFLVDRQCTFGDEQLESDKCFNSEEYSSERLESIYEKGQHGNLNLG